MAGQTAREALLAEALGDLGQLVERLEAAKVWLPEQADATAERIAHAAEGAVLRVSETARKAEASAEAARRAWAADALKVAKEVKAAALVVADQAGRMRLYALAVGFGGGIGGGVVAAVMVMRFF